MVIKILVNHAEIGEIDNLVLLSNLLSPRTQFYLVKNAKARNNEPYSTIVQRVSHFFFQKFIKKRNNLFG